MTSLRQMTVSKHLTLFPKKKRNYDFKPESWFGHFLDMKVEQMEKINNWLVGILVRCDCT